eukprot:TRINITY_DN2089_c0_g1_i2.p1 TRINITY_DN2089_c0_g1~~TRINITY_DN2089_c0_g1_i2.p1  ORF type:complete len:534 (+),score=80.82 TRINITY_DN2089_c0_g1_i2:118-1719(+)
MKLIVLFTFIIVNFFTLYSMEIKYNINFELEQIVAYGSKYDAFFQGPQDFDLINGTVIVLDTFHNRLVRLNSTLALLNSTDLPVNATNGPIPGKLGSSTWPSSLLVLSPTKFLIGGYGFLYQFSSSNSLTYNMSSLNPSIWAGGQVYYNNTLYIADNFHCGVYTFNLSSNSYFYSNNIINRYGQDPTNQSCPTSFPSERISGPKQIAIDCEGRLWAADPDNQRVVCYSKPSSSIFAPDITLGLPRGSRAPNANTLFKPWGIAFARNCSVLYVADTSRIVRFRGPFTTGQAAEGMLGFERWSDDFNVTDTTTFSGAQVLRFQDIDDNQGRLFILDTYNNRVVSGITSTKPPSNSPLYCTEDAALGSCSLQGTVTVINNQTLVSNYSVIEISGNLNLNNQSTVSVSQGQIIVSSGTVQFGGVLIITLGNNSDLNGNITVFVFNGSTGSFSGVQVVDNGNNGGCRSEGRAEYYGNSMSVIVTRVCDNGGGGVNKGLIIGVVLGVGGCAILVVVVLVVIGVVAVAWRHRQRPSAARV